MAVREGWWGLKQTHLSDRQQKSAANAIHPLLLMHSTHIGLDLVTVAAAVSKATVDADWRGVGREIDHQRDTGARCHPSTPIEAAG